VYTWPDGSEYSGYFDGHLMQGEGILKTDIEIVTGTWVNSKLHGQGERKLATGEFYRGNWINGKLTG
jgi:hypothetical protein